MARRKNAVRLERDLDAFGDPHAVCLSNDEVELIASTSYGPRVLAYRQRGLANVFGFLGPREQAKSTPFGEPWHIYGGHRLWHAPEDPVRSYIPDNGPIEATFDETTLVLSQPVERVTSLVKELRLTLAQEGSAVRVEHRITNTSAESVRLAVWALSVMAAGGQAIFPNPTFVPFPEGLLPASRLVLWPYTRLSDARFRFGAVYTRLRQDPGASTPQKLGLLDEEHGWAAYALGDVLFVKRYTPATSQMPLVDLGCNVETFTNAQFLELETLGAETRLAPGETATHEETWQLAQGVSVPDDDEQATHVLGPLVARA
jgi:hypothetical protein